MRRRRQRHDLRSPRRAGARPPLRHALDRQRLRLHRLLLLPPPRGAGHRPAPERGAAHRRVPGRHRRRLDPRRRGAQGPAAPGLPELRTHHGPGRHHAQLLHPRGGRDVAGVGGGHQHLRRARRDTAPRHGEAPVAAGLHRRPAPADGAEQRPRGQPRRGHRVQPVEGGGRAAPVAPRPRAALGRVR